MKILREVLAALGVLFAVSVVAVHYPALPQRIPSHFDAHGVVNGWGDKSSLWVLAGVACVLYVAMSLIRLLPASTINLPVGAAQREEALPMALEMIAWLKAETAWIFAFLCAAVVRVALGKTEGLSVWFLPVMLAAVFGTAGFYIVRMLRLRT